MLPELFRSGSLPDWRITDLGGDLPPGFSLARFAGEDPGGFPSCLAAGPGETVLSFAGLARFLIAMTQRSITVFDVQPAATPADIEHLLYDHVAPRILAEQGPLVVHGSGVEIDGALAVFLGETGAGKSTLAASLHRAGHRLHGDDAVVLHESAHGYTGSAVYPSLRLYPETIAELFGDAAASSPMAHYSEKQRVDLRSIAAQPAPSAPLAGLFFLAGGYDDDPLAAELMRPGEACMAILEQSFALDPSDKARAARRLGQASKLADAIPVYRLTYPHDFACMNDLHAVILACLGSNGTRPLMGRKAMND